MLKKLVEISAGKKVPLNLPAAEPRALGKSHSVANIEFKAKSLHFNQRKAELERIERENQKIAKKIFCLKSDLNKEGFRKDFNRHENIKNNMARIKKKRIPIYGGRPGTLPPLMEGDLARREGSAPTSADARLVNQSYESRKPRSDYHTVVHASSASIANGGAEPGPTKNKAATSRTELGSNDGSVASPEGLKQSIAGGQNVETVDEHPSENEMGDASPTMEQSSPSIPQ